jgi:hypothetical protein
MKQKKGGGGAKHHRKYKKGCYRFHLISLSSVGHHGKTTNTALKYATQCSAEKVNISKSQKKHFTSLGLQYLFFNFRILPICFNISENYRREH